jgi:two-component system sensor histidine kinase DevS
MTTQPAHSEDEFVLALVDAAPDGIVVVDDTGHIVFVNVQMMELFGYARDALVGLPVDDLVPERFRSAHHTHRTDYQVEPRSRAMGSHNVLYGRRKDGSEFPVEISLSPLRSTPTPQVVAVVRDVSQRLEAEAQLRRAERQLGQLEDRERIARDLHDLTIQRLFAAGMSLQAAQVMSDQDAVRDRIATVIDDLDDTIRELRSVIFGLQPNSSGSGLRTEIARVASEGSQALGFEPRLRLDGLIDSLDDNVANELLATLREAISNVVRHAAASSVEIVVQCGECVDVRVLDNGRGMPVGEPAGNGIRNMTHRAARLGGTCRVSPRPGGGTVLEWQVPSPR